MTKNTPPRRCQAHNRNGQPCQKAPIKGGNVCYTHGGATLAARLKAAERLELEKRDRWAAKQVEKLGGRCDITPGEALLELVRAKAAEVAYWERRVQQVDEESLLWGVTKVTEVEGTTRESVPHAALVQLHEAQRDLASYAAAALRAGVEDRLVAAAETTARQVMMVLDLALADSRLGLTVGEAVRRAVITDAIRHLDLAQ